MPEPVADWKDESAYPRAGDDTLLARWHWEFLRRNAEYQDDYRRYVRLGDGGRGVSDERDALARKYGLDGMMFDYRDPLSALFRTAREESQIRTVQWRTQWLERRTGEREERTPDDLGFLDPRIRQHECGVVFNMRAPLNPQLERARRHLVEQQARFVEKRGRTERYPFYLRLLDADAAGVPPAELAAYFFPQRDEGEELIREGIEHARRLRDVNYRYL